MIIVAEKTPDKPADSGGGNDLIVIPSHVSGLKFLDNLLASFGNYARYQICVVINQYRSEVEPLYQEVLARYRHLPITLGRLESNSFEFGGLLWAYDNTACENFFLLPHSCEIVDCRVFEIAFEDCRGRSAALFLHEKIDGTHIWESHIGKYRREALAAIDFKRFQPRNIYQATYVSEFGFTRAYHRHEPTAFAFCEIRGPTGEITEKFGRPRLKMSSPYLIKWKTHWTTRMLFKSFPAGHPIGLSKIMLENCVRQVWAFGGKSRHYLREGLVALRNGALWSPNFYYWRRMLRADPRLASGAMYLRHSRYNPEMVRFFENGEQHLHEHVLDSGSLVLDVGAFDGEYADKLLHRYQCRIHCYEPMPNHFALLEQRFKGSDKVRLYKVGLSNHTYETSMSIAGLGSSEFGSTRKRLPVHMQDVAEAFAAIDGEIDLLKINIEGGEYPLLERMLELDLLRRCKKVMVQFHDRPISRKLARKLRQELIAGIEKTHYSTFSYPFVWEGWQRRE